MNITTFREIDRNDIASHARDIATDGFTVIPPSRLGVTDDWVGRLRDAVVRAHRRRCGTGMVRRGPAGGVSCSAKRSGRAPADNVFAQATQNPVSLALIRLILGRDAFMADHGLIASGPFDPTKGDAGERTPEGYLPLRADAHGMALGLGSECHSLKVAWLCTDYTREDDGPIIVVPGSFRLGRTTLPHEWDPLRSPHPFVHLTGRAGSLAVWHGGTFHGVAPRVRPDRHVLLLQDWFRSSPFLPQGRGNDIPGHPFH